MNNRFKFRIWHAKDNNFVYYNPLDPNTISGLGYNKEQTICYWLMANANIHNPACKISGLMVDNETIIEQCTGFKDQNGTEIFEGDILEYSLGPTYREFVKWESGSFYLVTANEDSANPLAGTHVICQIVGNIRENPELLK